MAEFPTTEVGMAQLSSRMQQGSRLRNSDCGLRNEESGDHLIGGFCHG